MANEEKSNRKKVKDKPVWCALSRDYIYKGTLQRGLWGEKNMKMFHFDNTWLQRKKYWKLKEKLWDPVWEEKKEMISDLIILPHNFFSTLNLNSLQN